MIELTDGEDNPMISGQKQISKSSAVSVVAINFDVENTEVVKEEVHRICNDAALYDGTMDFDVLGHAINAEQAVNIVVTDDVISFGQNDSTVYLTPYENSLTGEGFTDEIDGSNIIAVDIGFQAILAVLIVTGFHRETVSDLKFVAASEDALKAAFSAEPVIKS